MKKRIYCLMMLLAVSTVMLPARVLAADADLEEIRGQIRVLTEEIEKLRLGAVAEPAYDSFSGLGPAASKIYGVEKGFSIGGYGEITYQNYQHSSKKDMADALRFILYGGYKFSDRIVMNTELEFEHAGIKNVGEKKSEVYVEFSYLDFLLQKEANIRTGLMLMPIGFLNEYHEPTVFHGVLRPDVERNIIPTTWREMGIMLHGEVGDLTYKTAFVNGLRSDLFSKSTWIKGGRQQGAEANADTGAFIGNLNYRVSPSLSLGGTYYYGQADEGKGDSEDVTGQKRGNVSLWETHTEFKSKGMELRGLYVRGSIDANAALEATDVGEEAEGWYVEAAYDIMPFIRKGSGTSLSPFIRYERYNTQEGVFSGSEDETMDRKVTTAGLTFKPHSNVVIKADYQWRDTESNLSEGKGSGRDENKIDQFNMGIGFIF